MKSRILSLLSSAIFAATVLIAATDTQAQSWNAALDLVTNEKPDQPDPDSTELLNPNGRVMEWSYGYRETVSGTPLTLFAGAAQHSNASLVNQNDDMEGWETPDASFLVPLIAANVSGVAIIPSQGLQSLAPDELDLHPAAPSGSSIFAVVRWTAPASGSYDVSSTWRDLDFNGGDGFDAHLVHNGLPIYDANVMNGGMTSFVRTLSLLAGDVLDFVVGPGPAGDQNFDSTALKVTIDENGGPPMLEFTSAA